jgi:hypothetical protein
MRDVTIKDQSWSPEEESGVQKLDSEAERAEALVFDYARL